MAALLAKLDEPGFTDILYYDTRFMLILIGIVPCLIFRMEDKKSLYGCLTVTFLALSLFDPIHEFFEVGYFQKGFKSSSYYYINYVALITFFGIVAAALNLKFVVEKAENENLVVNKVLSDTLKDVESQNEEITAQTEELSLRQSFLLSANETIELQKQELEKQVRFVNSSLQNVNKELVHQNNELREFSYTVSHNLRAPVARLLGLTHLAHLIEKADEETLAILNHIKMSAEDLDKIVSELSRLLENRNTTKLKKEVIELVDIFEQTQQALKISDDERRENFNVDFSQAPQIYTVRKMLNSILYHLLSNAIKFHSSHKLLVSIRSFKVDSFVVIEVKDNGVGINLDLFRNDMFRMYKQFHSDHQGRGLGLYLIKSQAESLNGFVEVESSPNVGSAFKVFIKSGSAVMKESLS
jgi:signal transduction histidine kinase